MPMEELIKFGCSNLDSSMMFRWKPLCRVKFTLTEKCGFPCGFWRLIASFGLAFFPMFYRLIEGRNRHFEHEAEVEKKVAAYLKSQGKEPPAVSETFPTEEREGMGCKHHSDYSNLHHRLPVIKRFAGA